MPSKPRQIVRANWAVKIEDSASANAESAVSLQEDDYSVLIKVRGEALIMGVTAAPEDGKASAAVIEVLARAFDCPKSSIRVARGHISHDKIFVY